MDGRLLSGTIRSFDKFSVMIDVDGQDFLLFKHAISTVTIEKKNLNSE